MHLLYVLTMNSLYMLFPISHHTIVSWYLECSCSGGFELETATHYFFHYPFVSFSWMIYSPEHYELNWWWNINQKRVICYSCPALWQGLFQRWGRVTYFKCNYWFYSFPEKNWWIILSFLIYGIICLFLFSWLKTSA